MELKATLKEYTALEFMALVVKIWTVDMSKDEHDSLINYFDRIVGHPDGSDLLFYPDDKYSDDIFVSRGIEWVMHSIRDWHHKQGLAAFKGEVFPTPPPLPPVALSTAARNMTNIQRISTDVAGSEQVLEAALAHFQMAVSAQRNRESGHASVDELENNIRALEQAQEQTRISVRKFEFWKRHVESALNGIQKDRAYARSDQANWQAQLSQISALHSRYVALLASAGQRYRALHDAAEVQLTVAQQKLVQARNLAGVAPGWGERNINASLVFAHRYPSLLLESDPSPLMLSQLQDFQRSIRSAVAEFTWQNTAGESVPGRECAAVLHFGFTSRADSQVYGVSIPLPELMPIEGQSWQTLAADNAQLHVPFRLGTTISATQPGTMFQGLREIKQRSQVYVTPLQGGKTSPVRVRAASSAEPPGTFSFTSEGPGPITVSWFEKASRESKTLTDSTHTGSLTVIQSSPVPHLEPLSDRENVLFDDYIVVFPEGSGQDPLYVMFRDRREYAV